MRTIALATFVAVLASGALADSASDRRDAANQRLDAEKRIAACTRLIGNEELSPREHGWAHLQRGDALSDQGKYEEAVADYGRSLELDPDNPQALQYRGISLFNLNRYDEAEADLTRALELDPRDDWSYFIRGRARVYLKTLELALADYDRSLELNPRSLRAYSARARLHLTRREFERAIEDAVGMIALDPYYADGYGVRGTASEELGRVGRALHDYAMAFAMDPNLVGPDGGLRRLVPDAQVEPVDEGPVAYAPPSPDTELGYLHTIKPQKAQSDADDAGLGDLIDWFKRRRVPAPTSKTFVVREVVSSADGVTTVHPRDRLKTSKGGIPEGTSLGYYRALWPMAQPMGPGVLLEIEPDRAAIDAFWPLEVGKTGTGTAVLKFVCPEEPTPMSEMLGCEPGKKMTVGKVVWTGEVVRREKVVVPVGAFEAVVVRYEEEITMEMFGRSRTESTHLTYWYAPSVGWWVKRTREFGDQVATDDLHAIE